jgi:hypothetical protein
VFTAHHRQAQRVKRRYDWTEPRGNATTRVYSLDGAATDVAKAAAGAVRGPGRDPYVDG